MNQETDDPHMNCMDHIRPSGTMELVTPPPAGYELDCDGTTIIAVDRTGGRPTLYFSFPERTRGWHPYAAKPALAAVPLAP